MTDNTKKPILALRCKKCGAVYMAQALNYPIAKDTAQAIAICVSGGDEPFITYDGVKLSQCTCDDCTDNKDDEA